MATILSWSHGFSQPTPPVRGSGGAPTSVEQANHSNLSFTKYLDSTTDKLLRYCWSGQPFGKVTLTCLRADGATVNKPVEYLEVVMTHVIISYYSISGGAGDVPVENVSLDYGTIMYDYIHQKSEDGKGGPKLELRKGT